MRQAVWGLYILTAFEPSPVPAPSRTACARADLPPRSQTDRRKIGHRPFVWVPRSATIPANLRESRFVPTSLCIGWTRGEFQEKELKKGDCLRKDEGSRMNQNWL